MPDDLKTTRTDLNAARVSIDRLERSARRRTIIVSIVGFVLAASLVYVGRSVADNRDDLERLDTAKRREAIQRCERANDEADLIRLVVRWQYEDYNIAPVNQTPQRQAFLANRLNQRLAAIERDHPTQDCDALPRPTSD